MQTYSMYKLFNGTFSNTLQKSDIPALKSKLEKFYATVSNLELLLLSYLKINYFSF